MQSLCLSRTLLWMALLLQLPSLALSVRQGVGQYQSNHTSNHAVILSSSRFWFNYRHAINALSIYNLIKKNGIPDENIILMLADEFPVNPRNPLKNRMYDSSSRSASLIDSQTQIDYRGDDVTVENLRRVLLGKQSGTKGRRVLHTDANSNVLLYWTGHGGDSFFKFQDVEEITSMDLKLILQQMQFNSLLFLADTCQAFTLGNQLADIPNVYMIGSSLKNENSYAHHVDSDLGLSVVERYTYQFMQVIQRQQQKQQHARRGDDHSTLSELSLEQAMVLPFDHRLQGAHVGVSRSIGTRPLDEVPLSDFFAAKRPPPREKRSLELLEKPNVGIDWTFALKASALSS